MITSVSGRVAALTPTAAVVEVGGVGLALQCTPTTLSRLRVGATARLSAALVVREESLTLFGFLDDDERDVFELLQTVAGVGPRLAQAVLSVHPPDAVRLAVATEDLAALSLVPGIGRKSAQRIVLELKDKLAGPVGATAPVVLAVAGWKDQLRTALTGLGWTSREADEALAIVGPQVADDDPDIAALLRTSLQVLSRS